jgi:large subunit ribosomal protein L25
MEVGKLTVTVRNAGSKGAARRLRAEGKVPGVCYGASTDGRIEPLPIVVDVKALRASLDPVRKQNTVIELTIEGGAAPRSLSALVKDYQLDPVRRDIIHVDLIAVDPDKEVLAEVPLEFTGKPKGTIHGGQLRFLLRRLELRAKPADIPVKLTIDVSELDIGDVTHVAAIELPPGVTAVTGRDLAVVTLAAPEEEKAPAAAEGAAPAEGAAAAPAAKDAKAAPAKAAAAAKPAAKK